jgi:hypothetical protein
LLHVRQARRRAVPQATDGATGPCGLTERTP